MKPSGMTERLGANQRRLNRFGNAWEMSPKWLKVFIFLFTLLR